jgi:hypothetical protein
MKEGKQYGFATIEKFVLANKRINPGPLEDDEDESFECEVSTLPFRFDDGTLALNFLLTGYGGESVWRCLYVAPSLE